MGDFTFTYGKIPTQEGGNSFAKPPRVWPRQEKPHLIETDLIIKLSSCDKAQY